jgi:hypothetical protein
MIDRKLIATLSLMVNEVNCNEVPMGSLYSELAEMTRLGATPDRVDRFMAQLPEQRDGSNFRRMFNK